MDTMKKLLVLVGSLALTLSVAVASRSLNYKTKSVDTEFISKQKKILELFVTPNQIDYNSEYYKIGKEYNIEANIDNYSNKTAVENFLECYKRGFMPKNQIFSVFYDAQREEAIILFYLFYYAKDFDTFYKTASYARVYFNEGQFLYTFYVALNYRPDTKEFVLPAHYEVCPDLFVNTDVLYRAYRTKMQDSSFNPIFAAEYGIVKENDNYILYSNYSNYWSYGDEYKLSYFTEDIGLNSYNYIAHTSPPFWLSSNIATLWKGRRGDEYFTYYRRILARCYLERLCNGLGEIPEFSWSKPIKYGYIPFLSYYYPLIQRPAYYQIPYENNVQNLQFLDTYEKTFLQYLENGRFEAYNEKVDLSNSSSINFVGKYWQSNADLFENFGPRRYHRSYEHIARRLLGASLQPVDKYYNLPSVLEIYQTALRDPIFYQFFNRVIKYFIQYKEYIAPYNQDVLHYVGVKVNDVTMDKLVTFFDFFDFDITNSVYFTPEQLKTYKFTPFKVRQPRLNHKPFTVTVDVESEIEGDAVIKIFMGPKYNSKGYPISLKDNWMNFVELDWFVYNLKAGQNKIERLSSDFIFYKEDAVSTNEIWKLLEQGKVPDHMSIEDNYMPLRLLLPKGTKGGFPYQIFLTVYPYHGAENITEDIEKYFSDNKSFGYPLDRPLDEVYFMQPNMFLKDVFVYHEDDVYPYQYSYPYYIGYKNTFTKF